MNSGKVISNIKKAIKEHLDNNYAYDMLVDFELDVIDWNSLFEYIDKLQQENQELKKQLEEQDKKLFFTKNELEMRQKSIDNKLNQQKEFIEYITKTIEELECEDVDDEEMKGYLIQRIDTFKEILSKYKEIIGDNNE